MTNIRYIALSDEDDELIDQLYDLSNRVGIRVNSVEEPFMVALTDNEQVVGASVVSSSSDEVGFSVVVDSQFQGKGIGKHLIKHVLRYAADMGATSVYADVVNDNVLRPYLAKIGFVPDVGRIMRLNLQEVKKNTMKTTKKQLEAFIRESVQKALEGLDRGDHDWLQTRRDDDAVRQQAISSNNVVPPAFTQILQAVNLAFKKIQGLGDPGKVGSATQIKREIEGLARAPQSGANMLRARMLTGKLIALSK